MPDSNPRWRLPFGRRAIVAHGVLALFTLGLWLLVPAALLAWRRGGNLRRISYGLWTVIGIIVLALGFSLGSSSNDEREAVEANSAIETVTATETITLTAEPPPAAAEARAAASPPSIATPIRKKPRTYLVTEVVDGDTLKLANGYRVRLVQIDSPELGEDECYSSEARLALQTLLPIGTKVRLEYDSALDRVDRFDRQLAYVFKGRENINHTLVLRGAASVWFFDGDRGRYAERLEEAARAASSGGRGLWGVCSATKYDPLNAVVAERPPPPPPPAPAVTVSSEPDPVPAPASNCHPSYEGACLDPYASDYDCAGGSGNGPEYTGYVRVVGPDDYGLDGDGDGNGCE